MKNILIVSYIFNPNKNVGARRASKFAKELSKLGFNVFVCTTTTNNSDPKIGIKDTYTLERNYPLIIINGASTFLQKIKYKIATAYLKLKSHGNIFDKTCLWDKEFKNKLKNIVQDNHIDYVFVSGPPFTMVVKTIEICNALDVKTVADIRDPWTWETKAFGYKNLTGTRKEFCLEQEKTSIEKANLIIVPTEDMLTHLHQMYSNAKKHTFLIPHAFDGDEIYVDTNQKRIEKNFFYYGTFYPESEYLWKDIANFFQQHSDYQLHIFSNDNQFKFVFSNTENVKLNNYADMDTIAKYLNTYTAMIWIVPEFCKDQKVTKTYEVLHANCPIIMYGKKGIFSNFIESQNGGKLIESPHEIINLPYQNYQNTFNTEDYSFKKVTESLVQLMQIN